MKKLISTLCAAGLMLCMTANAFAAEPDMASAACYPTAVTRSEDGAEIRKMYDLSPEDDPMGIPRSDFDQEGFHYTLVELLKQELPENESRQHTETVTVPSKSKDMGSVLALLPQTREFITEDGLGGVLSLQLDTVKVEVAGYGSSTKELSATRTYPGLASQDTSPIPKEIEDDGHTLTLQGIDWQRAGETGEDGSERFTAVANYGGSTTSSYVKGYTVTADYTGTVSRIALNKTRYPYHQQTVFCLDGDKAGQEATKRLQAELQEGGHQSGVLLPSLKDWNDDLCALRQEQSQRPKVQAGMVML